MHKQPDAESSPYPQIRTGLGRLSTAGICFLLLGFACGSAHAEDMSVVMNRAFSGAQFRGYQWLDYPVDAFGVASAYRGYGTTTKDEGFLCATFDCVGSPAPTDPTKLLQVVTQSEPSGYASVGCGGPVKATLQQLDEASGRALLSSILRSLSFSASVAGERAKTVQLAFDEACVRKLKQGRYEAAINALPGDPLGVAKAYRDGNLVVVVADVVVTGLHIVVRPDTKMKAALDGQLKGAVSKALTGPAGVQANVSTSESGSFELKLPRPLIVGYLAAQRGGRPIGRTLGAVPADLDWLDWDTASSPLPQPRPQHP